MAISSAGVAFTQALEQNLKNMVQELEDYKDKTNSLEALKFYKGDRTSITKFRICASEVRKEFQDTAKQLYIDLLEFQNIVVQIISLLKKAKTKNIEFIGIRLAMDEMKKWVEENPDAATDLLRMTGRENQLNYASLTNCQ